MGFSRHLKDTQTPEWKRTYIDYRRLRSALETIQQNALLYTGTLDPLLETDSDHTFHSTFDPKKKYDKFEEVQPPEECQTFAHLTAWTPKTDSMTNETMNFEGYDFPVPVRQISEKKRVSVTLTLPGIPPRSTERSKHTSLLSQAQTPCSPVFPLFQDSGCSARSPLYNMLSTLPAHHVKFFDMLETELAKVETFYMEREKEMHEHARLLRMQLEELEEHRHIFCESSRTHFPLMSTLYSVMWWFSDLNPKLPDRTYKDGVFVSDPRHNAHGVLADTPNPGTRGSDHRRWLGNHSKPWEKDRIEKSPATKDPLDTLPKFNLSSSPRPLHGFLGFLSWSSRSLPTLRSLCGRKHILKPCEYRWAEGRIREAVMEHYRGLEVLNDYRILNLSGFRKVLEKYAKITNISILDDYMKEKVEPSAFGTGALVSDLLKETVQLFAKHFEHGNRKKAVKHLQVDPLSQTHHFITFRSGLWLGLALPAIAGGSYLSFQEHTRNSLPSWDILLYIFSILFVPVLLALLIGIDIAVWARKRVNYALIFELDPRSRLDHRAYFELPSFLLCTLAYAFWFSLAQIGSPMLWPLIWLVLAFVVIFNPVRCFMHRNARWWAIKNMAKLGTGGLQCVKFMDVWLGDQTCSLVYSISNLYFLGCFYTSGSPGIISSTYDSHARAAWSTCDVSHNLQWYCLLGMLPFMIRFLQCLRQYRDSKLSVNLINAGKYAMGMVEYVCYCYWRYRGGPHVGQSYILMCFLASVNSIYACAWDFLMDWSMLKPHARYPLLRPELVYKSQIPCYYFALLSNLCIRFTWVVYIFSDQAHYNQHSFIVALLEVLRRVQWNIYRLENKHLENMRRYHITRDVPLPYNFETRAHADEKAHGLP